MKHKLSAYVTRAARRVPHGAVARLGVGLRTALTVVWVCALLAGCQPAPRDAAEAETPRPVRQATAVASVVPVAQYSDPSAPLRFVRVSSEEGLSRNTVTCMLQDRAGFVWLGTPDGLNRYDGYACTVFRNDPDDPTSLSGSDILSLLEDSSGALWVGTAGNGLCRYDRATGAFTRYDANDFGNLHRLFPLEQSNAVPALAEGPAGTMWIGTYAGLVKLDQATLTFTSYLQAELGVVDYGAVGALLVDRSDSVWIGTWQRGLRRFDPATGRTSVWLHDPARPESLASDQIRGLVQDASGRVWIATMGAGLERLDPETGEFTHYRPVPDDSSSLSSDFVFSISADAAGAFWIGTARGLNRFDPAMGRFTCYLNDPRDAHSLSSNGVISTYIDRTGVLWVGTMGGGVSRVDWLAGRFARLEADPADPNSLSDNAILSALEDSSGLLWFGTPTGLSVFDPVSKLWRHYAHDPTDPSSLPNNTVMALAQDADGVIWIGTSSGLNRMERSQPERVAFPAGYSLLSEAGISDILAAPDGVLWLATSRGLLKYEPAAQRMEYEGSSSDPQSISRIGINVLYPDPAGVVWAGTSQGLYRYDHNAGRWSLAVLDPGNADSIFVDQVLSICADESGMLWLGTTSGLARLDRANGHSVRYGTQQGLADPVVLGVLVDGHGYVWVGTNAGISRFDPRRSLFRNYGPEDGVAAMYRPGRCLESRSGDLLFCGTNGVVAFSPESITDNTLVPPVVLTSLTINGLPASRTSPDALEAITLRWPRTSFEFEFSALSYAQPERNQYAYMLEGFDRDWNYVGTRRYASYNNLRGGTYALRVKASNNDGLWNEVGASLVVRVVPPFWQTWWFLGLAVAALLGGAAGGSLLRVRRLQARGRELESLVEQRTSELHREIEERTAAQEALRRHETEQAVSDERRRLARDLHDSVSQALYGMVLYSQAAQGQLASGNTERTAEHLREVHNTALEALGEMRLLIFELRPPVLELEGLAAALHARLTAVERRAALETHFTTNLTDRLPPAVEEALYHIAREALNNVLKHAHARNVSVSLTRQERTITMQISDDGVGFDLASARERGGMGLTAVQERAASLGGRLGVASVPGKGTQITVELDL